MSHEQRPVIRVVETADLEFVVVLVLARGAFASIMEMGSSCWIFEGC